MMGIATSPALRTFLMQCLSVAEAICLYISLSVTSGLLNLKFNNSSTPMAEFARTAAVPAVAERRHSKPPN